MSIRDTEEEERAARFQRFMLDQWAKEIGIPAATLAKLRAGTHVVVPLGVQADALRYRYLRERCGSHYSMTHEQPAEWSIQWGFQQVSPAEAYGTFDEWIDADIARLDEDDRAMLAATEAGDV